MRNLHEHRRFFRPSSAAPQNYLGGIAAAAAGDGQPFADVRAGQADRGIGIHILESLFWRQAVVIPVFLPGHGRMAALHRSPGGSAYARRATMGLIGMACNFGGMIFLPMAEATTINLVPIFAVIFAALLLGDDAGSGGAPSSSALRGVRRAEPRDQFHRRVQWEHGIGTMIALGGALMTALITIAVRDLGRTENATTIVFWFSLLSMFCPVSPCPSLSRRTHPMNGCCCSGSAFRAQSYRCR